MDKAPKRPTVTVFIPVFNAVDYIGESIESVLGQTYGDFELVVIDDASTDGSGDRAESYDDPRLSVIRMEKNSGVGVVGNKGFALAKGLYLARLDADDVMLPDRLEKQIGFMEKNPEVSICGGAVEVFGDNVSSYAVAYPETDSAIRCAMLMRNPFAHSTVVMRMASIRQHDLGYAQMRSSEDYDLFERFARSCNMSNLPDVLVKYRMHASQLTKREPELMTSGAALVRRRLLSRFFEEVSEPELYCHELVSSATHHIGADRLSEIEKWLLRLLHVADSDDRIDPRMLSAELGRKWLNVCHRSDYTWSVYRRYSRSRLRVTRHRNYKGELRLAQKCFAGSLFR